MATVVEYARLSSLVYEPGGGVPDPDWEVFATPETLGLISTTGYYGIAYLKRSTNEIVLAHRGTELTDGGDLKSNWQYLLGNAPAQIGDAQEFYEAVLDKIDTEGLQVSAISHTGHSLGGAIARYLAADYGQEGIIFNAPGIAGPVQLPADADTSRIYAYNSAYDIVSAYGTQVGTVREKFVSYLPGVPDAWEPFLLLLAFKYPPLGWVANAHYYFEQHSMENLLEVIVATPGLAGFDPAALPLQITADGEVIGPGTDEWAALDEAFANDVTLWSEGRLPEGELTLAEMRSEQNLDPATVQAVDYTGPSTLIAGENAADRLIGGSGNDLLFGDDGNDVLEGRAGADVLVGGAGTDHLQGGTGDDRLYGGEGTDIYYYFSGDGRDTIIDQDGQGLIVYDGNDVSETLAVGLRRSSDPAGQYTSPDGTLIYRLENGILTVTTPDGGTITIEGFEDGDFGIRLWEWPAEPVYAVTYYEDPASPIDNSHGYYDSPLPHLVVTGDGNDTIVGSLADDRLILGLIEPNEGARDNDFGDGREGNDILEGGAGSDILLGRLGDDRLYAGTEADLATIMLPGQLPSSDRDWLAGGSGEDLLVGSRGDNALFGGSGSDVLLGGAGDDSVFGDSHATTDDFGWYYTEAPGSHVRTFYDTNGIVQGTAGVGARDEIYGGAGNDWLIGEWGDDHLDGGEDNDYLDGDAFNINPASHGHDRLVGGGGDDELVGNGGNDLLFGGEGDDVLTGDAGDLATAYHGDDYLEGGAGNDTLFGLGGSDTLIGGTESDALFGGDGDDALYGGAGDDFLYGGPGSDLLDGGAGSDDIYIDGNDLVVLDGADFVHKVDEANPVDLSQGFTIEYSQGDISQASIAQVLGTDGRQWLRIAFDAENVLYLQNGLIDDGQVFEFGGQSISQKMFLASYAPALSIVGTDGADRVYGSSHNDTLDGGAGDDTLDGQGGDDTYIVDSVGDIVAESANNGIDAVQAAVSHTLGANIENLTLTGTDPIDATGNELDNILTGNDADNLITGLAGNDVLDGRGGVDVLVGGTGDDRYYVDAADTVSENADEGNDTVYSGVSYTLASNVENLTLTGSDAIDGNGNALGNLLAGNDAANRLSGGDGDDTLDGGTGNDTLLGGRGDDTYIVNDGTDLVIESPGEGDDTVESLVTHTLGNNVENLLLTGSGAINGTGNTLNNLITGNSSANVLDGGAGNDTLDGGDGADLLLGAAGDDRLYGGTGADILDGGAGADVLAGETGNDSYRFGRGSGQDVIDDNDATAGNLDTIQVSAGVLPTDITIERTGDDLVLKIDGTTDQLAIRDFYDITGASPTAHRVERVTFATGGVTWDTASFVLGTADPDRLTGTAADDKIFGYDGDDDLEGLAGNDTLDGGAGSDIMVGGDGDDTYVIDSAGDVVVENDHQGTDTVQSFIDHALGSNLEDLALLGTVAIRGIGNQHANSLFGNDADNILSGGAGRDLLTGGAGSDTYVYNRGDGHDQISGVRDANAASIDAIEFGVGIESDDVMVARNSVGDSNLLLHLRDPITASIGSSSINVIDGFNATYGQEILDEIRFADGTVWHRSALYARYLTGGAGNDIINAFDHRDDVILGNAGDDRLSGYSGNDDMAGGPGNDELSGGLGDDIYRLGHGHGNDNVVDTTTANRVVLDAGVLPDDVTLYRTSSVGQVLLWNQRPLSTADDLVIALDSGAQLQVKNFFASSTRPISEIAFADGTVWGAAAIEARLVNMAGTVDSFSGTMQDDQYTIDHRGDRVDNEQAGGGVDTVTSTVTFILPANVENLNLTGPLSIGGRGNVLANTIRGNEADNYLDGATGADTLIGGDGDDVYYVDTQNVTGYVLGEGMVDFLDTVTEAANAGYDTVIGTNVFSAILPANVERLVVHGWYGSYWSYTEDDTRRHFTGNALDNVIDARLANASGGQNVIDGGAGADLMYGSTYQNLFIVDNEGDIVVGNTSGDTVRTTVSYALPVGVEFLTLAGSEPITGIGNAMNNRLDGSLNPAANVLVGGAGDDRYTVDAGDTIQESPGEGDDTVQSSLTYALGDNVENLTLTGDSPINGIGNALGNVLTGNSANNVLDGSAGNDTLDGSAGSDTLVGGAGDDTYILDGTDVIVENADEGTDTVKSSTTYILPTHLENLTLTGTAAIDGTGNALDNVLDGSQNAAANVLAGGAGDDVYVVDAADMVFENPGEGVDSVRSFSYYSYTLGANIENLVLAHPNAIEGAGNALDNIIAGNNGNNVLYGFGGNDTLAGNGGDDVLDGGEGDDHLYGGTGNDTYWVDVADAVVENINEGIDTVISASSHTLGAHLENLILTGTAAINGTGNSLNNDLVGNSAANVLDGGAGADVMKGGPGDDTYVVDVRTDVITESLNEGIDNVRSEVTYTLSAYVENLMLTGSGAIDGTGNAGSNLLDGSQNVAANILSGGPGDDTYLVGAGDLVNERPGEGTDAVQSSVSYTLTAHVEHLTLTGSSAIDGAGNELANSMTGNDASNWLTGGAGNDILLGGAGSDTLYGDEGDDHLEVGASTNGIDYAYGGAGNDTLIGGDQVSPSGFEIDFLSGDDGDDTLYGGTKRYMLNGGAGNDTLIANISPYSGLYGGDGNDTLLGAAGADYLNGGAGIDTMTGGTGDDTYVVDILADIINEDANEGIDTVQTDLNYTLADTLENLIMTGTAAVDATGNAQANTLTGNNADNRLYGLAGNDTLNGYSGSDTLDGGSGVDTMAGGAGNDIYVVDDADDVVTEAPNQGTDTVQASLSYTLGANVERLTLTGTAAIDGTGNELGNLLTGNSGANILTGLAGNDTLNGGAGNDVLHGGDGNDTLNGGPGADAMAGGVDDDTYSVDHLGDTVTENPNEGVDRINSAISYVLGANIENLTLTGTAAINSTGNELNNVLTGNSGDNQIRGLDGNDILTGNGGNDLLDGGLGADTMAGGQGNDTYIVNDTADLITESPNEGNDTVQSSIAHTLGANLENLTLTGNAAIDATGNGLANMIAGNDADNVLDGAFGDDVVDGGAGADQLYGGEGNDLLRAGGGSWDHLYGGAGNDTLYGGSRTFISNFEIDFLNGEDGDDVLIGGSKGAYMSGGSGNDVLQAGAGLYYNYLSGDDGNDSLTGSAGNDQLNGGLGDDQMQGGAGNDSYNVDSPFDVVIENPGEGTDTVNSMISYTLGASLENVNLIGTSAADAIGNDQNNVLNGSYNSAANALAGGRGDDSYVIGAGDGVYENADEGTDTVTASVTHVLAANVENLTLATGYTINGTGNELDNFLAGNASNNSLYGLAGDDTLTGNAGSDLLDGGLGADTLAGGVGNDTYIVDDAGDIVTEASNEGSDTVQSSITFTLGANVEHLTLTGTVAINGTGNELANTIIGNNAKNILTGNAGNDTLNGGAGDDMLHGGDGDDILRAQTGSGTGYESLYGNAGDDQLYGSANSPNSLWGGSGNDRLTGGAGGDYLFGDEWVGVGGDDILDGGAGLDYLYGMTGNDTYLFNAGTGSDLLYDYDATSGNLDAVQTDATPLDLVFQKLDGNLLIRRHGTADSLTIASWDTSADFHTEVFLANGSTLLNIQVDQLIQAMAQFSAENGGITWDQAIAERPEDVQTVLASYWQVGPG